MIAMMHAQATTSAEHWVRKRPFRPRERGLSARTNIAAGQRLTPPQGRLNSKTKDISPHPNKGGAPLGNRNAFKHGSYTRERREFYAVVRAFVRSCKTAVAFAKSVHTLASTG